MLFVVYNQLFFITFIFNRLFSRFFQSFYITLCSLRKLKLLKSLFKKNAFGSCAVCRFLIILQFKIT